MTSSIYLQGHLIYKTYLSFVDEKSFERIKFSLENYLNSITTPYSTDGMIRYGVSDLNDCLHIAECTKQSKKSYELKIGVVVQGDLRTALPNKVEEWVRNFSDIKQDDYILYLLEGRVEISNAENHSLLSFSEDKPKWIEFSLTQPFVPKPRTLKKGSQTDKIIELVFIRERDKKQSISAFCGSHGLTRTKYYRIRDMKYDDPETRDRILKIRQAVFGEN